MGCKDIINIHRVDSTNVGDLYCTPKLYFSELKNIKQIDIWNTDIKELKNIVKNKIVILGGGGLISNKDFDEKVNIILESNPDLTIGWGIGHNTHGGIIKKFPQHLKNFTLLGIRDYHFGFPWVPCVSCMHSGLDKKYKITNHIVLYEHKKHIININGIPRMSNNNTKIDDIFEFLGSAEIVITSTYHGAYWATLLNKKVIVINSFSSKFFGFKHKPIFSDENNYTTILSKTINYPLALQECREANEIFKKKVIEMIFNN